jgi:hypothetical protein
MHVCETYFILNHYQKITFVEANKWLKKKVGGGGGSAVESHTGQRCD